MSVFGPNQVGELIIAKSADVTKTAAQVIDGGTSDGEVGVVSPGGANAGSGTGCKLIQKTASGYEFSDVIKNGQVESIKGLKFEAEAGKEVTVAGFTGTPKANATYEVLVRVMSDGTSLSPENFRIIPGFYVTDGNSVTNQTIAESIVSSLEKAHALEGSKEFAFAAVDNGGDDYSITVTGKIQTGKPATDIARPIEFEVQVAVKSNSIDPDSGLQEEYNILSATTTADSTAGTGTGKYVANYEWFTKGYKYEVYRDRAFPAGFDTPYYANYAGEYDLIEVSYYSQRNSTNVERQYKQLTIAVEKGAGTGYTDINAIGNKIAAATGASYDALS